MFNCIGDPDISNDNSFCNGNRPDCYPNSNELYLWSKRLSYLLDHNPNLRLENDHFRNWNGNLPPGLHSFPFHLEPEYQIHGQKHINYWVDTHDLRHFNCSKRLYIVRMGKSHSLSVLYGLRIRTGTNSSLVHPQGLWRCHVQGTSICSTAQCLEVFEKYFLFFGPTCNFKYRKMISTINLPQTLLILTKFKI